MVRLPPPGGLVSKGERRRGLQRFLVESGTIVGSILLALALDAWWDGVQRGRERDELLTALVVDFEATRERLAASIARGDSAAARTDGFLNAAHGPDLIAIDSLRFLAFGPFTRFEFEPALSSYRAAVATGDIELIRSRRLVEALAEFDEALRYLEVRNTLKIEDYYVGPTAELRGTLGSLRVLYRDSTEVRPEFRISDDDYRRLARSPAVSGVMEGLSVLIGNLVSGMKSADLAAQQVLDQLRQEAAG